MSLFPGATLGPYLIQEPIGAGGMGAVWKARDTRLDRTVAIKTIEGRFSERFEREDRRHDTYLRLSLERARAG